MDQPEVIAIIQQELPRLMAQEPQVREFVLQTVSTFYMGRREAESRFDRILAELQRDREAQARKWEEQNRKWEEQKAEDNRKWEEQNRKWDEQGSEDIRKWDEQNRKWDEQNRKWDEQRAEDIRKWDEQNRKWDEQRAEDIRKWNEQLAENRRLEKRFDSTIGALGSRWGLFSEASFRNALAGILTESFGVEVLNSHPL
jgi:hypothetical protein